MNNNKSILQDIDQIVRNNLPSDLSDLSDLNRSIPRLAKDSQAIEYIHEAIQQVPTHHSLILGDARNLGDIQDESVHLVLTSPPYWNLKEYPATEGQLGAINNYDAFLSELDKVWRQCNRVLVEGGRLIIVVGDVLHSRRKHGRHRLVPLHASIQERCRKLGFDNLAPIIWHKISNITFEINNGSKFLGKPFEPNAIIKHDIEYILMQRKPGSYRSPSSSMRLLSLISEVEHQEWFNQIWQITGASTKEHPAPFPLELAERLIRMFSFVGDTVMDPFMGTGTTNLAASLWGRNSIGFEIDPGYIDISHRRIESQHKDLFQKVSIIVQS